MPVSVIVVPTYNEIENLPELIKRVQSCGNDLGVLIVDDKSPDGTGALADRIAEQSSSVHVLHRAGKLGLGTAYIEGFRWALDHGADYIFSMDGDLSHDPRYIPDFCHADVEKFAKNPKVENIQELFTVQMIVKFLQNKLAGGAS